MLSESRRWLIDHGYLPKTPKEHAKNKRRSLGDTIEISSVLGMRDDGTFKAVLDVIERCEKCNTWEEYEEMTEDK